MYGTKFLLPHKLTPDVHGRSLAAQALIKYGALTSVPSSKQFQLPTLESRSGSVPVPGERVSRNGFTLPWTILAMSSLPFAGVCVYDARS